ncbi:hypothetical protein GLOTRDRAFT_130649 [Gloeophyllum trabeum ATCC 11539]|uniref:Uncharacterized protein n=1 Tax=Gloeophyllum trabeum (strain ATCC 11539 / FP-39264 / Madison 617) TaxID=670483 RepID=S7Q428_GLOTA|nr:uncharacterized protein GLOTRDRAFT_130649 [Gloeophyllum trabeum ATCC 11539]EPQ54277.1 hypothetical protein GLOTRDRAFT_130649 [Gloeophyllum trabeum ATCC 11539]
MSFPFYQNAGDGRGTAQYRFGPPPTPQFQPQPHWEEWDYFRAHSLNPDRAIYEAALDRVDVTTAPPSEIGHAAAYKVFRIWRHHGSICAPLGGDIERQWECLMALAIEEATCLCQYSGCMVDRIGCQVAADAAASTASLIFSQTEMAVADQQGDGPAEGNPNPNPMEGMGGNMGNTGNMDMDGMGGMGMGPRMGMGMGGMQSGMGPGGMGMNQMGSMRSGGMGGGRYGMGGMGPMGGVGPGRMGPMARMGGGFRGGGAQSPYIYDDQYTYTGATPTSLKRTRVACDVKSRGNTRDSDGWTSERDERRTGECDDEREGKSNGLRGHG